METCDNKKCEGYSKKSKSNCMAEDFHVTECSGYKSLTAQKDPSAESPAAMLGSTARCDEADHVLIKFGSVEHGMDACEALDLAIEINKAAFLAAHKAGIEQGQ